MDQKKKIKFSEPKISEVIWNEQRIKVKQYLSLEEQVELMKNYVETYFKPSLVGETPFDYLMAEYVLMINIIDVSTDILVTENKDGSEIPAFTVNQLLSNSELWTKVKSEIKNYNNFYSMLQHIVSEIREERLRDASVGSVLDKIYENISMALTKLLSFDLTDENVEGVKKLLDEINKSELLKASVNLLKENNEK